MAIVVNWFPVEISPASLDLPTRRFASFEESTAAMKQDLQPFACYRPPSERGPEPSVQVVLLNGPPPPEGWTASAFNASMDHGLFARMISDSANAHFRKRGALTYHDKYSHSLHCHWVAEEHPDARIRILTGVRLKVHQPSSNDPFGLVISWDVAPQFTASLEDDMLRSACLEMSVILKCRRDDVSVPDPVKLYRHKFLGHVDAVESPTRIAVHGRDGNRYILPSNVLSLEASPATLHTLEHRTGIAYPTRRLQELSFVLTKDGRRNSSVLRHRLDAIMATISPHQSNSLILPLQVYGGGKLIVDLTPLSLT